MQMFYYMKPKCAVRVAGEVSEELEVKIGVRQGCILSPLLFSCQGVYQNEENERRYAETQTSQSINAIVC